MPESLGRRARAAIALIVLWCIELPTTLWHIGLRTAGLLLTVAIWPIGRLYGWHLRSPGEGVTNTAFREVITLLLAIMASSGAYATIRAPHGSQKAGRYSYLASVVFPLAALYWMSRAARRRGKVLTTYFDSETVRFTRMAFVLGLGIAVAVLTAVQHEVLPYIWNYDSTPGVESREPLDQSEYPDKVWVDISLSKELQAHWYVSVVSIIELDRTGQIESYPFTINTEERHESSELVFNAKLPRRANRTYMLQVKLHQKGTATLEEQKKGEALVRDGGVIVTKKTKAE